ncbi:hypothetical protein D3C85_1157620 [compost metagenome]
MRRNRLAWIEELDVAFEQSTRDQGSQGGPGRLIRNDYKMGSAFATPCDMLRTKTRKPLKSRVDVARNDGVGPALHLHVDAT